jgi:hypothetical protein
VAGPTGQHLSRLRDRRRAHQGSPLSVIVGDSAILVEEAGERFCDPGGGRRLALEGEIYSNGQIDAGRHELQVGP